jgi:zinc protease
MRRILLAAFLSVFASVAEAGDYVYHKLNNGLDLILVPAPKVPIVTIVLVAKAGAMTESKTTSGLTHLWEHMFFKGNARLPTQEAFKKRIRELGIEYNGDTSAETVRYYFTLPAGNLEAGLQFMADAISTPLLDQKELERERHVVMDEYDRNASQPGFRLNNIERMLIYGEQEHLRNPLGRRSIIEKTTRQQLLDIKKEVFVPQNSAIVISGALEVDKTKAAVEKHFASWTSEKNWKPIVPAAFPKFPESTDITMLEPNAQNALIQMTWQGPSTRKNAQDTYETDVLIGLLQHRSGKFYEKFVDSGLTFETAFSYHTQGQTGELSIYSSLPAAQVESVKKMLAAEFKNWNQTSYFTEEQLTDVKRKLTVSHKFAQNRPSSFAKDIAFWWSVAGLDYYDSYISTMQKITIKQVTGFVDRWLIGKPYITTTLVNAADAEKTKIKDTSKEWADKFLKNY